MPINIFRDVFRFGREKFSFGGPKIGGQLIAPLAYGASFLITVSPQYCASDAGHTTPCTNGTSIASWFEQVSKTWTSWVAFGSTSKPLFNVSGSQYNANFTNGTRSTFQFPNTWPQNDITIVMRFTPQANVGQIISSGSDSGNQPYNFYRATTTGPVQRIAAGPTGALTNGTDLTFSYTATGTNPTSTEKMRISGAAWATVNNVRPSRSGTSTTLDVGFGSAGQCGMSNFKGLALFPSVLTDAQITAVESYFNSL